MHKKGISMLLIVCPNPSLDCFATPTPTGISVYREIAGGSGINVGRSLRQLDTKIKVVAPLGGFNGYHVRRLLKAEGLPTRTLMGPINTRQTCYTTRSQHVTFGNSASPEERTLTLEDIYFEGENPQGYATFTKTLIPYFKKAHTVLFCGALPPHFPSDSYAMWCRMIENPDTAIYMDTPGQTLSATLAHPDVRLTGIKINRHEWEAWTGVGFSTESFPQQSAAAAHRIAHIVVTDGPNPIMGYHQGRQISCRPLVFSDTQDPGYSVGSGDAFMAGFVWGLAHQRLSETEALQAGTLAAAHHYFNKPLSRRYLRSHLNHVEVASL